MFDFLGAHGLNKGGAGGGTATTQETDTVVIMRSSAPTTVTLATAIPGSSSGATWTNGDKIGVTNGDIYTVDGSGNTSLTRAMTTNTVRRVAVTAGTGTGDGTLEPGLYVLSRDNTSTVLMSAPQKSISTMLVHKVGSVWNLLSAVLGDLDTLTTTAKTSFVAAINELKAALVFKTINSKTLNGASTNMVVGLADQSVLAKFDATVKPASVTLTNAQMTGTWSGSQGMIRADQGHVLGTAGVKRYFEMTYNGGGTSGNAAVGVVGLASANNIQIGYNGAATHEIAVFQNSGNVYRNGSTTSVGSGTSFGTATNVVGVAIDVELKKVWFRTNNGIWNNNASNNPATNVGGLDITGTLAIYPAVCSDTNLAQFTLNTGASAFANAAPSGFTAWFAGVAIETLTPADALITAPVMGDVLTYNNGGKWVNQKPRNVVTVLTPSAGVVNIDWSLGDYFTLSLTGTSITSITFSNLPGAGRGATLMIRITQDTTPRTVAWPASFRWEGAAPVVSTGSGAVDVLAITDFTGVGTKWDATLSKGRV